MISTGIKSAETLLKPNVSPVTASSVEKSQTQSETFPLKKP